MKTLSTSSTFFFPKQGKTMEFKSITNEPRINLDSENRAFSLFSHFKQRLKTLSCFSLKMQAWSTVVYIQIKNLKSSILIIEIAGPKWLLLLY
jgi:hypothetical protein